MKKINENFFLSKLNEAQDNNARKFYCELIETQKNFDSEYKIEKLYYMCKIYYENNSLLQTIDISNTIITYIKYFLDNLNYTPLPKTVFYLNSVLLMTMKLLIDSNLLSNIVILYSKYLYIIKNEKIKEIIKSNKGVRNTKKKIISLFKEAKTKFQEQLNTRKEYFSILNLDSTSFQDNEKKEICDFFNSLEEEISQINLSAATTDENMNEFKIIENNNDKNSNNDNTIYYVVNTEWLQKFLEFKKFFDDICKNVENYKYFLFTGFDADNVIVNIINDYSSLKSNIVSYIGPIINESSMLCIGVMPDSMKENNNYILTNGFTFVNEKLYNKLSDFFGIDFEIKREKKYFHIKFVEIMVLNRYLVKKNISSICKEVISLENDITYEELKQKIIRCLKYKYDNDYSGNKMNIYIYDYKDVNDKDFLNNQNFQLLLAYGLNLVDKLYLKANLITSNNFNEIIKEESLSNDSFLYVEILDNDNDIPFLYNENENICIFCNKEIKNKKNIVFCDENEKCLNKYCSNDCKFKDKKHILFHNELNKYYIQYISLEELLNEEISFPKNSKMGLTGLVNIGNTCFMNSALQCLSNCFQLTKYFLSNLYVNEINTENKLGSCGKIAKTYKKLLKQLWKENEEYIYPNKFRDIFIQYERQFSGYGQHDSNEFLIFLLDILHEDLNKITDKQYIEIKGKKENENDEQAALRWWKSHTKREDSIIVNLFHGQYKNKVVCCECGKNSITYDPFMILSLPLPSARYNLMIKFFGYTPGDYHEFNIAINEKTICSEIELKIIESLNAFSEDKKNEKKRNNKFVIKKRKTNKKKVKADNNNYSNNIDNNEINNEININSLEFVLLTKNKNIYKILDKDESILEYIVKGYEIVAYEKETITNTNINNNKFENDTSFENIYFYLINYINKQFLCIYPYIYEHYLLQYPLPISIQTEQTLFNIYEKIYYYIRGIKLFSNNQKEELININSSLNNISFENEQSIGFLIYINLNKIQKTQKNICSKIYNYFNNSNTCFRMLEKYSANIKYNNIKEKLKIFNNKRLVLNVDIKCQIDINKLPKIEYNKNNKLIINSKIDLYDCLELFNSEEKIQGNEYFCSKCKKYVPFLKKMDIYKEPYYLIIHLKRFKNSNDIDNKYIFSFFNNIKNNIFIDFPIQDLDLTDYVLGNNGNKKILYNLIGVINHYGGAYYGHYTASCLNRNKWYKFDDEIVSLMKEKNIISESAYVLFYQRVNH